MPLMVVTTMKHFWHPTIRPKLLYFVAYISQKFCMHPLLPATINFFLLTKIQQFYHTLVFHDNYIVFGHLPWKVFYYYLLELYYLSSSSTDFFRDIYYIFHNYHPFAFHLGSQESFLLRELLLLCA